MAQSIAGALTALTDACTTIYATIEGPDGPDEPGILVTPGAPGQYQPSAIVAVGWEVRTPITRPTMGPSRSREQVAEIDVVMSVWRAGDETVQADANTYAYSLLDALETYLRAAPNEKLGGTCYDAWVSNAVLQPDVTYQALDDPDEDPVPTGRVAAITATVTVKIRY